MSIQDNIYKWEHTAGIYRPRAPTLPMREETVRRISFIAEEFGELATAFRNADLVEVADALGDLLWVVYGTAHACGISLDPVVREIARSNWTKFEGGVQLTESGKVIKGPHYSPPDIAQVLLQQEDLG